MRARNGFPPALLIVTILGANPALAARLEIILDVSGSMRAPLGGETKMDAARKAIRATADGIAPGSVVALRLYGHRVPQEKKDESCRDTELVVGFQPLDKADFLGKVERATPRGQTPLTYSLEQAAQDFGARSDEDRVIILVSDGEETCGGDPAAAARRLLEQGFKVKVHTIGFDVDAAARAQLEAISQATGGEYHDARNAAALGESLTRLANQALLIKKEADVYGQAIRGGNGYETAVALQPGTVYHLDHHQREDQFDYFAVEVKDGQKITAWVETGDLGVEIQGDSFKESDHPYAGITLLDPARKKIADGDVIGTRSDKKILQVPLGAGQGGRFYVLIGSSYSHQHKDSRFRVDVTDLFDAGSSRDAGSREAEAVEIRPGSFKGYLHANDTLDYLKFRADPAATYAVRVRPAQAEKKLEIALVDADGAVVQEAQAANPGAAVRAEGLRFPKGGDVFLKIANHAYSSESASVESEYTAELTQAGGAAGGPASPGATTDAAGAANASGSLLERARVLFVWSVLPLGAGLLVGFLAGFLMGRARRA